MTSDNHRSVRVRLTACAVLTAAPALLALATAASSYGDTGNFSYANTDNGPNSSVASTHHQPFRGQNPQTDRVWYQTPNHNDKPAGSTNPLETLVGQLPLENFGPFPLENFGPFPLGNLGPLGHLGLGNLGFG